MNAAADRRRRLAKVIAILEQRRATTTADLARAIAVREEAQAKSDEAGRLWTTYEAQTWSLASWLQRQFSRCLGELRRAEILESEKRQALRRLNAQLDLLRRRYSTESRNCERQISEAQLLEQASARYQRRKQDQRKVART